MQPTNLTELKPIEILERAKMVALRVRTGGLSYEDGRTETEPLLTEYNQRAKKVARKFNRKWYDLTYTKLLRLY